MKKVAIIIVMINLVINAILLAIPRKNVIKEANKSTVTWNIQTNKNVQAGNLYFEGIAADIDGEKADIYKNTYHMNDLGDTYIGYSVKINEFYQDEVYEPITVVDEVAPKLYLKGSSNLTISLGTEYQEPGYEAVDSFDGDLTKKVTTKGTVNKDQIGDYMLTYHVCDSSNNCTSKTRKVRVRKQTEDQKEQYDTGEEEEKFKPEEFTQTVTEASWTDTGIKITFYSKDEINKITCKDKNVKFTSKQDHYYTFTYDLKNLKNGTYTFKLNDKTILKDEREQIQKLVRSHIGDHLITVEDNKKKVQITIEDFAYEYDILIDAGHGGTDIGSSNSFITEKALNLEQTLYEKKRYEDHGLKVLLIRDDDSYGLGMGDEEWKPVTRRAYAMGYYGVVSKIVYSNHHNSYSDSSRSGFEILVPASLDEEELKEELTIYDSFKSIYPVTENHVRFYARNIETSTLINKENGNVYDFVDYYAVNRIPLQLFGVKAPIFEGSYLSNEEDFEWYYQKENWKKLSEAKIKAYVESLGVEYKGV